MPMQKSPLPGRARFAVYMEERHDEKRRIPDLLQRVFRGVFGVTSRRVAGFEESVSL